MSGMVVAVHQPNYLAYPGLFDKWDVADLFVLLDHVAFSRSGWQNRNYISGSNGRLLLTVPVCHGLGTAIADAPLAAGSTWQRKHRQSLNLSYQRATGFGFCTPLFDELYSTRWRTLGDVGRASCRSIARLVGISTESVSSSELGEFTARKSDLLVEICRRVGASTYLSGDGAAAYLDLAAFDDAQIEVRWQGYQPPIYRVQGPDGDLPENLSIVDMMANLGPGTLNRLREARKIAGERW